MAFTVLRPGEYRVGADPDSQTSTITVRVGDGEVTGGGQTFPVHARERVLGYLLSTTAPAASSAR